VGLVKVMMDFGAEFCQIQLHISGFFT
jgi:hypothetical protein